MHLLNQLEIDWDKVETLEDVKSIIKCLNITFNTSCEGVNNIAHLLRVVPKPVYKFTMD